MTVDELILLDKAKVRRDSNLMHLYLQFFEEAFGRVPNCAGCSFGTDWSKLVAKYSKNSVTLQKVNLMKTIEIKKKQGKILTYKKEGKTYRLYDNILNDNFIKGYIEFGVDGTKESREKMFNFPSTQPENILIDTSKVKDKFEEVKETLSPDSTDEEIENAVKEVVNVIEIKPAITGKKRGRKSKK